MKDIKMTDINVKCHYVKTYPNWKLTICKWIKVQPLNKFSVELSFSVDKDSDVGAGDVVCFDNHLRAQITYKEPQGKMKKLSCALFLETPVSYFSYSFSYLKLLYLLTYI